MIILIHTSKTMRPPVSDAVTLPKPQLIAVAKQLDYYLKTLPLKQLVKVMHLSTKLADKTHKLILGWTESQEKQRIAIDSFLGDIYSGLQVQTWTEEDRSYANQHLRILSGLYGILRPLDGIYPYRLEMGYRLPKEPYTNLYKYWGESIVKTLPSDSQIINLAANEYSKVITDYVNPNRIISPVFLTNNQLTNQPTFVVVHTKIARGAFAAWLIKNKIDDQDKLKNFNELGYEYSKTLSNPNTPTFICKSFGGIGLSVRLR